MSPFNVCVCAHAFDSRVAVVDFYLSQAESFVTMSSQTVAHTALMETWLYQLGKLRQSTRRRVYHAALFTVSTLLLK